MRSRSRMGGSKILTPSCWALPMPHEIHEFVHGAAGDISESASLTRVNICQLGNTVVGAAEPPTELAVDILQHHHIRGDVGLVVGVEVSGRKLVQHGWTVRDDSG